MIQPMADSNIKIISELKNFLEETSQMQSKRNTYSLNPKDFTRNRKLDFKTLSLLILHSLKRSLSVELQDFFGHIGRESCTKQAFSAQRGKLKPSFLEDWNALLVKSFYGYNADVSKKWKGMLLWSIDGSTTPLPNSKELREKFGCPGSRLGQSNPAARICVLYDVMNHLAIKGLLQPYAESEEKVVLDVLEGLELSPSLLLFDRGYPSYWLMYCLIDRQTHFVMRVPSNANRTVKAFIESDLSDLTVDIYPSYKSLAKLKQMGIRISQTTPVKVRYVKVVLDTGEVEVLATNLYDSSLYRIADLKKVYFMRWGIETFYGYVKEELQLGQFSGIRDICIRQDFAANLFLFNLQSLIEKQCEPYIEQVCKTRIYKYKVNKNISWASMKYGVVKLFLFRNTNSVLMELQHLFERHLVPIRPGRKFPRARKGRPNCKNYTLTNYKRAL